MSGPPAGRPLRAALIGAGAIAKQHLACLRALPGVQVAAVCDLSPSMAEAAAERFGVPRWYTDHAAMLAEARPDVVHVTTPPPSHFRLATDALAAGAHVVVEKPATVHARDLAALVADARGRGLAVVEDYNYLFNSQTLAVDRLIGSGAFGEVVHVDVLICLDIRDPKGAFADPNAPHPALSMPGGAIADFLSHLASLAHHYVGPHRGASTTWRKRDATTVLPSDEFRALVDAERGTAFVAFSAHARPDTFTLRVHGTAMRATANLFETRLSVERVRGGPRPLVPVWNGLAEARAAAGDAAGGLWRKLSGGPGAYEGLWELLARTYRALGQGGEPPVSLAQVAEVNALVEALKVGEGGAC